MDKVRLQKLFVVPDKRVNVQSVEKAFAVAKSLNHTVVLIDHIDHVGADPDAGGYGGDGARDIKAVNNAVLELAKQYDLCVIAMSQCNASINGDGTNPLLRFQRPQLKHVAFNSLKIPNANQIWGVFRDIDAKVTRDEFCLAREGGLDVQSVLMPNCTSLVALKLRDRGKNEGRTLRLWYQLGQLQPWTEQDKREDTVARMMSQGPFAHNTTIYRQRRAKDGTPQHARGTKRGDGL